MRKRYAKHAALGLKGEPMTDENKDHKLDSLVDDLPDMMTEHDIAVLFLGIMDTYDLSAEDASFLLEIVHGTYLEHKRKSAMN